MDDFTFKMREAIFRRNIFYDVAEKYFAYKETSQYLRIRRDKKFVKERFAHQTTSCSRANSIMMGEIHVFQHIAIIVLVLYTRGIYTRAFRNSDVIYVV